MDAVENAVTKLLDRIMSILDRDGKTIGDLAREIGKSYHQTYYWVKVRRFKPGGDAVLLLKQWADRHA